MIERVTDWEWVKRFLTDRLEVIGCGMVESDVEGFKRLLADPRNFFVRSVEGAIEGLWVFVLTKAGYEVHACTERKNWGGEWVRLGRAVLDWFCSPQGPLGGVQRLVTHCPEEEWEGNRFAVRLGFRTIGRGLYPNRHGGARQVWWYEREF